MSSAKRRSSLTAAALLLLALPLHAETEAERIIRQSVCGAWKPGTGLTSMVANGVETRKGWIHSVVAGEHKLHVSHGGTIKVWNRPAGSYVQEANPSGVGTIRYHLIRVIAPVGAVLEWTKPDGTREPIPQQYLYPMQPLSGPQ